MNITQNSKFFVIKSYSEDNIIMSIKYNKWSSTQNGNEKLNKAFVENNKQDIYLFFSVNASGQFLGVAKMTSEVIPEEKSDQSVWVQDGKWKGAFNV